MPKRIIKFNEAIREATDQTMSADSSVFVIGLGIPNGMGGTTDGLKAKYPARVLETPTSEAAVTGFAVGAAVSGLRPIVHYDRVEFSLLAADQIFTQAAKWNYMFGGGNNVPIVFRIVVGRQWGNGPQHSQALYSLFGNVMGLKVVVPSTPRMAKGLLVSAVRDKNPVVILEPRWLYNIKQDVPVRPYTVALDKARIEKQGKDVTVVGYGDGLYAAREALPLAGGVKAELIDLVSINPVDYETIRKSVRKTRRLLCVDTTNEAFSVGSEVMAAVAKDKSLALKSQPISVSCPDVPCPTSVALSEFYYPTKVDIANGLLSMFGKRPLKRMLSFEELHLAPTATIE